MEMDIGYRLKRGDNIALRVIMYNDNPVFQTEFVHYDQEVVACDLARHGINEDDYEKMDEFLFGDQYRNFRSARIYHLADGENFNLIPGDQVRAEISSITLGRELTKDGRYKLHVQVRRVRRIYVWKRRLDMASDRGPILVCTLFCGIRDCSTKKIPVHIRKAISVENGRAVPVEAYILPNGSVLKAIRDHSRETITTGDYRLRERQKHRTMKDIDQDFVIIPQYDRMVPARNRRRSANGVRIV